jgi:hypothetical protein
MADDDIPRVGPEPPADNRITELYAWVAVHPNGGEGVMATGIALEGHGVIAMTPLVRSNRESAERIGDQAHELARLSGTRAELRRFKMVMH